MALGVMAAVYLNGKVCRVGEKQKFMNITGRKYTKPRHKEQCPAHLAPGTVLYAHTHENLREDILVIKLAGEAHISGVD